MMAQSGAYHGEQLQGFALLRALEHQFRLLRVLKRLDIHLHTLLIILKEDSTQLDMIHLDHSWRFHLKNGGLH